MPAIIAGALLAGAAAGVGFTAAAGLTFAFSWSAFTTTLLLGAVSQAFAKKPDQGTLQSQGRLVTIRQPISYWQVVAGRAAVSGVLTFRFTPGMTTSSGGFLGGVASQFKYWHMVITFACHEIEAFDEIYFNDELITLDGSGNATGKYAGYVRIKQSLGVLGEGQPFPDLVAESGGAWSNDHLQDGHAKLYIRLLANQNLFPAGVPNVWAVVRGAKIYDPRSASTAYSNNPALWVSNVLTNSDYGFGAVFADEIDADELTASANTCDEAVSLAAGGTESRYTANGSYLLSETPKDVIGRLNAAMSGKTVYIGDTWRIIAGAYTAPTVTLDEDDLAGPVTLQAHLDDRENANGIRGTFRDPNSSWQPTDFPALASATYLAEDNGERQWQDMDLTPFVTSVTQAQRLSKIALLKIRQGSTFSAAFKMSAYGVLPGKTVAINFTKYGLSAKVYEVVEADLQVAPGTEGATLQVALVLRETAAAVFDWATSEEATQDIAPNTTLPDAGSVAVPGQPDVSEALYETRDGRGVAAKAMVSWVASSYAFGPSYQLEYKLSADSAWTVRPVTRDSSDEILDIAPGTYDFRVKAIGVTGQTSAYSSALGKEINGLTAAPGAPTGVSIQAGGGTARLKLDQAPELDVRRGGRIVVRFCHEGVIAAWESAFSIGEPEGYPGDSTQIDLPLKPGTYLLKARDSTGHESESFASIATKQASVLAFTTLSTLTFETDWAGTFSGTAAPDGQLTLGGTGMWDDIPDLDAETDIDGSGGIATEGTWTADTGLDLGAVTAVRLTSRIEGGVDNLLNQIDDRTGNVDDWLDWDGASFGGSAADAFLECRETDDDPAASPTWSDWKRLDAAEFNARAFQFRAHLTSSDAAYRPLVSVLRVTAEGL